jgi:hypothetical protein
MQRLYLSVMLSVHLRVAAHVNIRSVNISLVNGLLGQGLGQGLSKCLLSKCLIMSRIETLCTFMSVLLCLRRYVCVASSLIDFSGHVPTDHVTTYHVTSVCVSVMPCVLVMPCVPVKSCVRQHLERIL